MDISNQSSLGSKHAIYQSILVATDGSELSQRAISSAVQLAAIMGAKLFALKVVQLVTQSLMEGTPIGAFIDAARLEEERQCESRRLLDRVRESGAVQGVAIQTLVVLSNDIAGTIIATANEHRCDLIVMASHGRRGLSRVLLGSETQHVLVRSALPVLVLR